MSLKTFIVCVLSLFPGWVHGQKLSSSFKFQNLTNESGLSQSSVTTITEDAKGFIWVGTRNGLNKYDGYDFTIYQHSPDQKGSITDNSIKTLMIDNQDRLWVGTGAGGLLMYDEKADNFIPFDQLSGIESQYLKDIAHVFQDSKGVFWISTIRNGLVRWDEKNKSIKRFVYDERKSDGLRSNYLKQFFEDKQGRLWLLSDAGIDQVYDRKNQVFFKHYNYSYDQVDDLPSRYAKKMIQDDKDRFWVATDGGLSHFDPITGKCINYQKIFNNENSLVNNFTKDICIRENGKLWIATDDGVDVFDTELKSFIHIQKRERDNRSLISNYVKGFYKAKNDVIWIASDGGVSIYDEKKEQFELFQFQYFDNSSYGGTNVYAVYKDLNNLWVGTDAGLFIHNRSTNESNSYINDPLDTTSISNNSVKIITKDSEGNIWIGTDGGFSRVYQQGKKKRLQFENFTIDDKLSVNNVLTIVESEEHHLWVGTWAGGLIKFDLDKQKVVENWGGFNIETYGLNSSVVWVIYRDSKGRMWVVTSTEIGLYDNKTDSFKSYVHQPNVSNSLSSSRPTCMIEDYEGYFWIGTMDGGLNKFDADLGTFEKIDPVPNFGSKTIFSILEDSTSQLWMSTSDGVISYQPKTKKSKKYSVNNGLQSKEYNLNAGFEGLEGQMYFGGPNGLNIFNPYTMEENLEVPKVYITEFQLFNMKQTIEADGILDQSILTTSSIELRHNENVFSFKFAGLNFRNSTKNQYSYKLEGIDRDWQFTTQNNRQASYTQVPPGEYVFSVKASNDDSLWNEEGASIKITILPPWWLTWWAKTIWIGIFAAILLGVYWTRMAHLKQQRRHLELEIKRRTREVLIQKDEMQKQANDLKAQSEELINNHQQLINLNDYKESMTAMIVHDFKNSLNTVISFSEGTPTERRLKSIRQAGQFMLNMVLNILD
ncbi:MAG: hypothetical protein OCD76_25310, partial [Reichenbachiella sp.]